MSGRAIPGPTSPRQTVDVRMHDYQPAEPPIYDYKDLKKHIRRLEDLINSYQLHLSASALASMLFPSLAFADIPAPHVKVREAFVLEFHNTEQRNEQVGYLLKLVGRVKKTWRKKLFLLKNDMLFCYEDKDSLAPDKIIRHDPHASVECSCCRFANIRRRLHKELPVRPVELYLTSFKEVKKGAKEDVGYRDLSSCYPFALEISIAADLRSSRYVSTLLERLQTSDCACFRRSPVIPPGKCLLVHAYSEESQRDWFYCLKRAATLPWYRDANLGSSFTVTQAD